MGGTQDYRWRFGPESRQPSLLCKPGEGWVEVCSGWEGPWEGEVGQPSTQRVVSRLLEGLLVGHNAGGMGLN